MCRKMKSGDGPQLSHTTLPLCSQRFLGLPVHGYCVAESFFQLQHFNLPPVGEFTINLCHSTIPGWIPTRAWWTGARMPDEPPLPAISGNATRLSSLNRSWTPPSCRSIPNARCCGPADVLIMTTDGLDRDIHGSMDCLRTCDGPVRNVNRAL